jgi:hypothetical protein
VAVQDDGSIAVGFRIVQGRHKLPGDGPRDVFLEIMSTASSRIMVPYPSVQDAHDALEWLTSLLMPIMAGEKPEAGKRRQGDDLEQNSDIEDTSKAVSMAILSVRGMTRH